MCAVFGFLDYGKVISHSTLTKLLMELSIAAECRGTDATGISYVNDGKIVTFKKAKPAHKVNLYFPKGTTAVIGHTRFTTQGSEKQNYNNHPFEGRTAQESFALAHNGVLYHDSQIRAQYGLPDTKIETDSYIAVQLLEYHNSVNRDTLKDVAETVTGSFVFTILRNDNTLFLVKGDNPLTVLHFPEYGLYVYASTMDILLQALKNVHFCTAFEVIDVEEGTIAEITQNGKIYTSEFTLTGTLFGYSGWMRYMDEVTEADEYKDNLLMICNCFGVDPDDVELLLEYGYTYDEIEEMLLDDDFLQEELREIKALEYSDFMQS